MPMTNEASLRQYASAITRAQAMAFRLGIRTQAKTLTGLMKAIRQDLNLGGFYRHHPRERWKLPPRVNLPENLRSAVQPSRRRTLQELIDWQTQGPRDRARTLPRYATLKAVIEAAVAVRSVHRTERVARAYQYPIYESIAAATRQGQAIRFRGERHRIYPGSQELVRADYAPDFIMARDLWAAIPPLPPGWRLLADENGPFVQEVETNQHYHPTNTEWASLVIARSWEGILNRARGLFTDRELLARAATNRKRPQRDARLVALIARFAPNLPVTLEDSERAGNCVAGTLAWARRHGIRRRGASASRIAELAKHDSRAGAVLIAAYRRARTERRMRFTAGGLSAPAAPIPG